MNIKLGLINIFISLLNTVSTILFFIGFLLFADGGNIGFLLVGIFLMLITEAGWIYLLQYEKSTKLLSMKDDFLKNVGSTFAWPVLLFILHLLSQSKSTLVIAFILTVIATIKVTSLIIKVYLIDNNIV